MTATRSVPDPRPFVLITGVRGRIGRRVAEALHADYRILGFDLPMAEPPPPDVTLIPCDLTDEQDLHRALRDVREHTTQLASVVHLAAYYDFSGEPSPLYDQLTVQGTRRLLEGLADFEVEQFVFSSSMLVMQPVEADDPPIEEDSPLEADWDYPRSKLEAEAAIRKFRRDIPAVILRIAGVYDDDCSSIPLAQQARRIHEKTLESHFFPGRTEHGQSFVHVEDVARSIQEAIRRRHDLGPEEVFLIGEPDLMSYEELQDRMGQILHGKDWTTLRIPQPLAKVGAHVKGKLPGGDDEFIKPWMIDIADAHYPVSIEQARTRLGWVPCHRLRDDLETMLAGLKSDPDKWYATNGLD